MVLSTSTTTINDTEKIILEPRRTFPQFDNFNYYNTGMPCGLLDTIDLEKERSDPKVVENLSSSTAFKENIEEDTNVATASTNLPKPGIEVIYQCKQETTGLQTEEQKNIAPKPSNSVFRRLFSCVFKVND